MNDFSELEDQLKKLKPVEPSTNLVARIERTLAETENCRASATPASLSRSTAGTVSGARRWRRFTEWNRREPSDMDGRVGRPSERERASQTPYQITRSRRINFNWLSLGLGLAAATAFLIFANLNVDRPKKEGVGVTSRSPISVAPKTATNAQFIPADFTRVVYRTSDEGLHFRSGSEQPLRRLRSQTRETFQWRNPRTGASLRVSYPSEEVSLIPVSGQ